MLIKPAKEYFQLLFSDIPKPQDELQLVPDDFFQSLLQYTLGRDYLEEVTNKKDFLQTGPSKPSVAWVKIERLPVHPSKVEDYNLLPRWQSVLSTIHLLRHRLIFLLMRNEGKTGLYLGVTSKSGFTDYKAAANQLCQSVTGQMPGTELSLLSQDKIIDEIAMPAVEMNACGAVTGIPSPRKVDNFGILQTLDQLAFGIRDSSGYNRNYALIVVAGPVPDGEIVDLIGTLFNIATEIHDKVQRSVTEGINDSISAAGNINVGALVTGMLSMVPGAPGKILSFAADKVMKHNNVLGELGSFAGFSRTRSSGYSKSVSRQYLDKAGQYCEQLIDKYIKRLEHGRNLGFWNTGVYVLGDVETTVNTVMGMLRATYAGEETYVEPIRAHLFPENSGAVRFVKQFQLVPYPYDKRKMEMYHSLTGASKGWHPLGPLFEGISTPLNTEELSIATSLPRRDVPGLRFVRNAVRFAANPPKVQTEGSLVIGQVMDTGVPLNINYTFDINTLTKHGLVTGITGSGKSTTCRRLLSAVASKKIPFLVIEPAKEEYVSWAVQQNKSLPEKEKIRIFMPGTSSIDGVKPEPLMLNPFEPGIAEGGIINMTSRLERFKAAFIASMPMQDVLPLLIEESLYEQINRQLGPDYLRQEMPYDKDLTYPLISELPSVTERLIGVRGYEREIQSNLKAAVQTRINSLTGGWKGSIFNVPRSTPYSRLFEGNVVINLSKIADERDKSLIMSLLLIALCEYRESKYHTDRSYKARADRGELCQLTIIEEAHRLLKNTGPDYSGSGNPQAVASNMFCEMLSEIRAYGQGLLIVDQVPSRLIPDAIKNTNLKIVHRIVAKDDRQSLSGCMGLRQDQEDTIASLPPGQAIICGDNDDAASWVMINR